MGSARHACPASSAPRRRPWRVRHPGGCLVRRREQPRAPGGMPIELERFREHDWPVEDLPPASVRTVRDEGVWRGVVAHQRSEEHTSELQSLMRISYAVFCLKKKKK